MPDNQERLYIPVEEDPSRWEGRLISLLADGLFRRLRARGGDGVPAGTGRGEDTPSEEARRLLDKGRFHVRQVEPDDEPGANE